MWCMTSYGILMPAIRPPETVEPGDTHTMQIRSRRRRDLDILRSEYMPDTLGPTIATPTFDYEFRAYCEPVAFALAMAKMVEEIDYEKFKPTTDRYKDNQLHSLYNAIWSTMFSRISTPRHHNMYLRANPPRVAKSVSSTDGLPQQWWELLGTEPDVPWYKAPYTSWSERDEYQEDVLPLETGADWDPETASEELSQILSEFDEVNEQVLLDLDKLDDGDRNGRKPMTKRQRAAILRRAAKKSKD